MNFTNEEYMKNIQLSAYIAMSINIAVVLAFFIYTIIKSDFRKSVKNAKDGYEINYLSRNLFLTQI